MNSDKQVSTAHEERTAYETHPTRDGETYLIRDNETHLTHEECTAHASHTHEEQARTAHTQRTTKETTIDLTMNLDGTGTVELNSGIGFFDHMLEAFGRHGLFDLSGTIKGDLEVDGHHTVEDTGIVLGQVCARALGSKRGITRYGSALVPMDEALVLVALDISGRGALFWEVDISHVLLGAFDSSLAKEFFTAFAAHAGLTLHVRKLAGENTHHIIEAVFKAVARALRQAIEIDERAYDSMPSTKGAL